MKYLKTFVGAMIVLFLPAHVADEYGVAAGFIVWFSLLFIALAIMVRNTKNDSD